MIKYTSGVCTVGRSAKNSRTKQQANEDVPIEPQFPDILIQTWSQVSQIEPVWKKVPAWRGGWGCGGLQVTVYRPWPGTK